jgi:HEAT repeat protein
MPRVNHFRRVVPGLIIIATLFLSGGCGGDGGDATKKVDVAAQVAALKGSSDAKQAALSELAAGGKNSTAAVNDIVPLLKDEDAVVRRLAAYALGQIGPAAKVAIPSLKAMLTETDINSVTAAVNAINSIDPSANDGIKIQNVTK